MRERRYDEVLTACNEAIAANPNDVNAWIFHAETLFHLKRHDEALASSA
jgi:cytochrome c-type biogenesis protein CcmH/NrfG